jgi:hypothetical protein
MVIETADRSYEAEGVVAWSNKVPSKPARIAKKGMGIKFTHVDPELVDLYEEKLRAAV